ncbi:MAG: hypothetical protein COB20_01790 [SAR86 cluster bacterium]|uniref:CENP-V/GFA domain-containing protein n=1 Tax=SAR86 cluster bacterium TaxID=2030880 RepID=A0A2A4XFK9_9GAMM|nr:MAG: hypothetical protein COB20_01790 [SAR86 cluster bacterium]
MVKVVASCQCGQLKFEAESEPVLELICHCPDCQDALQADFANIAFFKLGESLVKGELAEKIYLAESGNETCRQYCVHCETVMFDRSEGFPNLLGVMVSQLYPPFESRAMCHVFVRDKKAGVEIPEGMKQYETGIS